jgi:hypothetical protein
MRIPPRHPAGTELEPLLERELGEQRHRDRDTRRNVRDHADLEARRCPVKSKNLVETPGRGRQRGSEDAHDDQGRTERQGHCHDQRVGDDRQDAAHGGDLAHVRDSLRARTVIRRLVGPSYGEVGCLRIAHEEPSSRRRPGSSTGCTWLVRPVDSSASQRT